MRREKWIRLVLIALSGLSVSWAKDLTYRHYKSTTGARMHVIELDPQMHQLRLIVSPSRKKAVLSKLVKRHPDALAAINGGFFMKNGDPSGFFKHQYWWSHGKKRRGVVGFGDSGLPQEVYFDQLMRRSGVTTSPWSGAQWWDKVGFVVEGAPLMIRDGHIMDLNSEQMLPSFIRNRYARSGICLRSNHEVLLVMASGGDRQSYKLGYRRGLSLYQFAKEMQKLGCLQALNLDGGYSSSMLFHGKVINGHWMQRLQARPIANAIAVVPVKK